jgi:hypothetical protein
MQYRTVPALLAPVLLTMTGVSRASTLHAQTAPVTHPRPAPLQLGTLSRERAARWAAAAPVIHCSPAPLTERPGTAGELARPRLTPLEDAFLDAVLVKRTLATRARLRVADASVGR